MKTLTLNQLILLLDIKRGTCNPIHHTETFKADLTYLIKLDLCNYAVNYLETELTNKGIDYCNYVLNIFDEIKN